MGQIITRQDCHGSSPGRLSFFQALGNKAENRAGPVRLSQVMLHIRIAEVKLALRGQVIATFSYGQADNLNLRVSHFGNDGGRIISSPDQLKQAAYLMVLIFAGAAKNGQAISASLALQSPIQAFIARQDHGAANSPISLVRICQQLVGLKSLMGPVEIADTEVQDTSF